MRKSTIKYREVVRHVGLVPKYAGQVIFNYLLKNKRYSTNLGPQYHQGQKLRLDVCGRRVMRSKLLCEER